MKIEPGKYYKTRNGNKVRIYAQENTNDGYSVHGAILYGNRWEAQNWHKDGYYSRNDDLGSDIIEVWVEPKYENWAFVEKKNG